MAERKERVIRVKVWFIENFLDKIIEQEKKRGRDKTSYADASQILGRRIIKVGGLKE